MATKPPSIAAGSNDEKCNQRIKGLVLVLRALVTSLKPPILLSKLLEDYREVECQELPYRDFGFTSPQDFLASTGEFNIQRRGPDILISLSKINERSAHIVSMVAQQKASRSVGILQSASQAARPRRGGIAQRGHSGLERQQSFHPPTTSNGPSLKRSKSSDGEVGSQHKGRGNYRKPPSQTQNAAKEDVHHHNQPIMPDKSEKKPNGKIPDGKNLELRPQRPTPQQKQPLSGSQQDSSQPRALRPILGRADMVTNCLDKPLNIPPPKKGFSAQDRLKMQNLQSFSDNSDANSNRDAKSNPSLLQKDVAKTSHVVIQPNNKVMPPILATPEKVETKATTQENASLPAPIKQPHLKGERIMTPPEGLNTIAQVSGTKEVSSYRVLPQKQKNTHKEIKKAEKFVFDGRTNAVELLRLYCIHQGYDPPQFSTFCEKFTGACHGRVVMNGHVYTTFPNEYRTVQEAELMAAEKAIASVEFERNRVILPRCTDSYMELVQRLYNKLKNLTNGVFLRNFPEWFEAEFQMILPENWRAVVETSQRFIIEKGEERKFDIIYANMTPGIETTIRLEGLKLPWGSRYWSIQITECVSSTEIWARIMCHGYKERFDTLQHEMNLYMKSFKISPQFIQLKDIYLVWEPLKRMWHRVRVEEMNKPLATALCFYIDSGIADWVLMDDLYVCDPMFLTLPAQAVPFVLFGLEDFEGHPYAKGVLDSLLLGSIKRVDVLTKETEFNKDDTGVRRICIVLFKDDGLPASAGEDESLNDAILKAISNATPKPTIEFGKLTNVLVPHVSDDGCVYLQIQNGDLNYVETTLRRIARTKLKPNVHFVRPADLLTTSTFLVCHKVGGTEEVQWYRGVLANGQPLMADGYVDIFYEDFGDTRRTHITCLYRLDCISAAIAEFPPQGLRVALANIPPNNDLIMGRMRALLPRCSEALVKLVQKRDDGVPLVTLYKQSGGTIVTVNDVIRIEYEIENSRRNEDSSSFRIKGPVSNPTASNVPLKRATSINELFSGMTVTSPTTESGATLCEPQTIKEYDNIPPVGQLFEVRVSLSSNPTNFMVQPYVDCPALTAMMKELQNYCESTDAFIPVDKVERGQAYAAKNPDGFYHRVVVINTYSGDMIHVRFCDFGDTIVVRNDQLKVLPQRFRQLPQMAVQAKLYGVIPHNAHWTVDDCHRFRALTVGRTFVATIKDIGRSSPEDAVLELELCDTSNEQEDVYLDELLIKEGRALRSNTLNGIGH